MRSIGLKESGTGPLLFCLHGIGSSSSAFAAQLDGLSEDMHVVAWDAPGYGDSQDPEPDADMSYFAHQAADLIESFSEPAYVLGVSWGGVIATILATRRPDLVSGAVLVSASRGSGRSAEAKKSMLARISDLDCLGLDQFAISRARNLVGPNSQGLTVELVAKEMVRSIRPAGYKAAALAMANTDTSQTLSEISMPVMVVCGSNDQVTGPAESEAIASGIPGSVLVRIEGAGHLVNQEVPAKFNAWVSSFVDLLEGSRNADRNRPR